MLSDESNALASAFALDAFRLTPRTRLKATLKFLMEVDTITPGKVPFMNFEATSDFGKYLGVFNKLFEYNLDLILPGRISFLGTRQDVIETKEYLFDVRDTVLHEMESMYPRFYQIDADMNHVNGNLGCRAAIEAMRHECAAETRSVV